MGCAQNPARHFERVIADRKGATTRIAGPTSIAVLAIQDDATGEETEDESPRRKQTLSPTSRESSPSFVDGVRVQFHWTRRLCPATGLHLDARCTWRWDKRETIEQRTRG